MKRTIGIISATTAIALSLAGCGPGASSSEEQWTDEIKAAGVEAQNGASYQGLYDRTRLLCESGSKESITSLLRLSLSGSNSTQPDAELAAPDRNPKRAAETYADATWKYVCAR